MRICSTGNPTFGLAKEIAGIFPNATFLSRSSGFDLTKKDDQERAALIAAGHDVFINCAALWKFHQTVLLDAVFKVAIEKNPDMHIICIGSTTDKVNNSKPWLYNAEKKALRDYCNTLSIGSVWSTYPKVSYISFGTLTNNQSKHPDRKCLDIINAARYIKWLIDQPKNININEISIDPMQDDRWYKE